MNNLIRVMRHQQLARERLTNTHLNKERKVVNRGKKEQGRVKHYYSGGNVFLSGNNQLYAG